MFIRHIYFQTASLRYNKIEPIRLRILSQIIFKLRGSSNMIATDALLLIRFVKLLTKQKIYKYIFSPYTLTLSSFYLLIQTTDN